LFAEETKKHCPPEELALMEKIIAGE